MQSFKVLFVPDSTKSSGYVNLALITARVRLMRKNAPTNATVTKYMTDIAVNESKT